MSHCYSQLNLADRRRLHHFVERKLPINEMARQLGRHRSTIYREIRRNTFHDRELPEYSGYFSTVADDISKERRRRLRKLRRHPQLRELVIDRLRAYWSPEQIAGRLWADGLSLIRICAETIYRFVYGKEDYGLGLFATCQRHAANDAVAAPRGPAMASSLRLTKYRNVLILLMIARSSVIGKATC